MPKSRYSEFDYDIDNWVVILVRAVGGNHAQKTIKLSTLGTEAY